MTGCDTGPCDESDESDESDQTPDAGGNERDRMDRIGFAV